MKITNKYSMPQAMVHAVSHDRYDPGTGDVSCTTLIAPAQQFQLGLIHSGETEEDVIDRIWSLIGSAVHYIIENAVIDMKAKGLWKEEYISEKRFYHVVGDKNVSAQIDLYEAGDLSDFKVTSVWTIKHALKEGKDDWDAQLNIQRYLMTKNGYPVDKLYVVAIARDWNKSGNMRDSDYPPRVAKIEIPVWDMDKTEGYIQSRINALYSPVPVWCSPAECWESPTKYALMKKGRQSALRLLDSMVAITEYADCKDLLVEIEDHKELKSDHYYEVRLGERKRCQDYCDVAPFCPQWKEWQKANDNNEEKQ
jgi:hypothetical protein